MLEKLSREATKKYLQITALGKELSPPKATEFRQSDLFVEGEKLGVPLAEQGSCLGVCLMYTYYTLKKVSNQVARLNKSPNPLVRKKFLKNVLVLQTQTVLSTYLPLNYDELPIENFDFNLQLPAILKKTAVIGLTLRCNNGNSHIISISNIPGQYSLFDPNLGEVTNLTTSALNQCLSLLMGHYLEDCNFDIYNVVDLAKTYRDTVTMLHEKPQLRSLFDAIHNCKAITYFLARGVNVNQKSIGVHATPLWFACAFGYTDSVKLLLEAKADMNIRGYYDLSCRQAAEKYKHPKIVELLDSFSQAPDNGQSVSKAAILPMQKAKVEMVEFITQIKQGVIARSLAELAMA
jgi:hypothetical protein